MGNETCENGIKLCLGEGLKVREYKLDSYDMSQSKYRNIMANS